MAGTVTIDQVHTLAAQLPPRDRRKLAAQITDELSETLHPASKENAGDDEQSWAERLRLADELLAEAEGVEEDSQGGLDSAELIRRMRDERIAQLCPRGA